MRWVRIFFTIGAVVLLAVTAFSFLGQAIDVAELMANFRPQLLVAAVLLLAIGLLCWSRWTLILAVLACLANGWPLFPYYYPAAEPVAAGVHSTRVQAPASWIHHYTPHELLVPPSLAMPGQCTNKLVPAVMAQ